MSFVKAVEGRRCGDGFSKKLSCHLKNFKCAVNDVYANLGSGNGASPSRSVPIFINRFCPTRRDCHFLAVANEAGYLGIRDTDESLLSAPLRYHYTEAHQNAVFDLAWCNDGSRLLTASGDHSVYMWDLSNSGISRHLIFMGHTRSVRALTCTPFDDSIFASGARDGVIHIWDTRKETAATEIQSDNFIAGCHLLCEAEKKKKKPNIYNSGSITGLAFLDSNKLISCSSSESIIKVWDIRKCYRNYKKIPQPVQSFSHNSAKGFSSLTLSPCRQFLFSCCSDQSIVRFNTNTQNTDPDAIYKGVSVSSYFINVTVSPCGNFVMSGSSDDKGIIWAVNHPESPLATLCGHTAEVSHIAWKPFGEPRLASCSDDGTYRIWRLLPDLSEGEDYKSAAGGWVEYNELKGASRKIKGNHGLILQLTNDKRADKNDNEENSFGLASPQNKRRKILGTFSPTANLPNIVEDGISPHRHVCKHPVGHQQLDWLTQHRQTTPPQPKPRELACRATYSRRRSSSSKTTSKVNLLKFFKVTTKSLDDQGNEDKQSCDSQITSSVFTCI